MDVVLSQVRGAYNDMWRSNLVGRAKPVEAEYDPLDVNDTIDINLLGVNGISDLIWVNY